MGEGPILTAASHAWLSSPQGPYLAQGLIELPQDAVLIEHLALVAVLVVVMDLLAEVGGQLVEGHVLLHLLVLWGDAASAPCRAGTPHPRPCSMGLVPVPSRLAGPAPLPHLCPADGIDAELSPCLAAPAGTAAAPERDAMAGCRTGTMVPIQPSLTFSWYWRREESSDWMRAVAWPMNMA